MIFDGHAYCFPSMKGNGGFPNSDQVKKHLQHSIATHHQPVWRSRDRAPGNSNALIDDKSSTSLRDLKEADFRVASHGRFAWTVDGEDYFKQYIPPSNVNMDYPAENLVAEMDYAGVDRALLHRCAFLGVGNEFIADCVKRFPDRLLGLAHTEEWLIKANPEDAVKNIEIAVSDQGLSGIQFTPMQLDLYGDNGRWDSERFRPFWDGIQKLNIPVFLTLMNRDDSGKESYLNELKTLIRWMERYPDVKVVHTHGFTWRLFLNDNRIELPDDVWIPFSNPNLYLQLLFPVSLGNIWDYPMPQVRPTIEECVNRIGADRLIWGTDMPMVSRFWTYRQNIDFIKRYCDFLSQDQLDKIMGGAIENIMGIVHS